MKKSATASAKIPGNADFNCFRGIKAACIYICSLKYYRSMIWEFDTDSCTLPTHPVFATSYLADRVYKMPPRRARGGSRSQARQSRILTEEEEEQNRNLQLLLDDIDESAEMYIKDIEESVEGVCKSIVNMYTMGMLKVPPATKALTLVEFVEQVCNISF